MKRFWIVFYTYFMEDSNGYGWTTFVTKDSMHLNLHYAKKAISKDINREKAAITNFKEIANESDFNDIKKRKEN